MIIKTTVSECHTDVIVKNNKCQLVRNCISYQLANINLLQISFRVVTDTIIFTLFQTFVVASVTLLDVMVAAIIQ